jgi:putative aldouronate transport system substrate-binding protein
MRKKLILIVVFALVLALFAGCGNAGDAGESTPETGGNTANETDQPSETQESSPYQFAAGNYETDENGIALAPYEYALPLTTSDEAISYWNVCYTPQYIPEDGFGALDYPLDLKNTTGVNIDYICVNAEAKFENFSVLLASDDLPDLMAHGLTYYGKSARNAIDEGWFANLYDYKEYMPNYLYQVKALNDPDVYNTVYYDDETIIWFYGIMKDATPSVGFMTRGDWLDELGLNAEDITTFDEVHDMLTRFKTELSVQWPMEVFYTIELAPGVMFSGYNTSGVVSPYGLPWAKVIDGQVQFTLTTDDDRDLMTMLSQWYSEELIDPAWPGYTSNDQMSSLITTGQTGYVCMNPSQAQDFENAANDPEAEWAALSRPLLYEGQILKYGQKVSQMTYGNAVVSAKCENIPLLCTWSDYFFSPAGSDQSSWGPEGITWEKDENGNRMLTDFVLDNPDGIGPSWVLNMYAGNNLCDATLFDQRRSYAYDGGERLYNMFEIWTPTEYSGEYDFPTQFKLTDEQQAVVSSYSGDITTYIGENYLAFFDGSKPMSEWDSYVDGLNVIGLDDVLAIYQEAYQVYAEKYGA